MFRGKISLNSLLLLLVNFMSGFKLELSGILYLKYQAKSHTHLHVFQLLALRAILCRNHFFVCVNRINLLKLKFRQASNRCKKFLKLPNLHMLIK